MRKNFLFDRRTFLKGAGATLALPLLETMSWAKPAKPPVRLGFMYMPHGVIMDQFWPATTESFLSSPPPALESLRPVLDQCLLMKGISGVPIAPFNGAPHALELSTWLTAILPDAATRNRINIAISADQIAANYVGALTSLPSLELATMPQTHKENQEGLNEGYYSHCSFRSPTQAGPAEIASYKVEGSEVTALLGTPALDRKGQPIMDVMTGRQVVNRDPAKEQAFFKWLADHGITDTNQALAKVMKANRNMMPAAARTSRSLSTGIS